VAASDAGCLSGCAGHPGPRELDHRVGLLCALAALAGEPVATFWGAEAIDVDDLSHPLGEHRRGVAHLSAASAVAYEVNRSIDPSHDGPEIADVGRPVVDIHTIRFAMTASVDRQYAKGVRQMRGESVEASPGVPQPV
jgi:hypothetical protein